MSDDSDEDKQHEPSQKKLEDARKKGEIPRSTDLFTAAGYAGFLMAAAALGAGTLSAFGKSLSGLLIRPVQLSDQIFTGSGPALSGALMAEIAVDLAPFLLLPTAAVLLCVFAQQAFTVTPSKIAPKFSRISLLGNARNKFGRGGLFEFAKSFVKLVIYSAILGSFLWARMPSILNSIALTPGQITLKMLHLSVSFLMLVLAVATALGAVDFLWQRAEHMRRNRMSHKDLRDEAKQSEGDPQMKQQRRQKGYDIAMNSMLADVQKASVVIVNPTHYAVALEWTRAAGRAPVCVAKGVDEIAARIRERAAEHGIPLHSDPATARLLHATLRLGEEIRPDHYAAVAVAIRFAEEMRRKARRW
ncbi:EscU/YscU/HrcU family type III secretion system export apparatus switch protein [Oceaniglobus roseus]|uniref:EscU/YscU/HrcU family type III secretion system export apparatus switch protein n=1 Tax=Oceaniglobus roseus TaxID=1737570 RepID=UPI000C7EFB3B|nr:flagellar type III secretion system protein FlhB [Kandeliimicrobium roseum]